MILFDLLKRLDERVRSGSKEVQPNSPDSNYPFTALFALNGSAVLDSVLMSAILDPQDVLDDANLENTDE